jgi:hypothetical protein
MAQTMSVSVALRLRDEFTGPVRQLVQNLQQLTRVATEFNRALGGSGSNTTFGRLQSQTRALNTDVRQLASSFQQLGRAMGTPSGGGIVQGQVAGMRQLLGLQQQAMQNQARLNGGGGSGRVPNVPGGSSSWGGFWGRRGFSPNASLADRAQYRAVNMGEQSLVSGFLDLDRARTRLSMLAAPNEGQRPILRQEMSSLRSRSQHSILGSSARSAEPTCWTPSVRSRRSFKTSTTPSGSCRNCSTCRTGTC